MIDHNDDLFGCSGDIQILSPEIPASGNNTDVAVATYHYDNPADVAVATYHYDNPWVGSDSSSVDCAAGYTCTIQNNSNNKVLSDTITICSLSSGCSAPTAATTTTTSGAVNPQITD